MMKIDFAPFSNVNAWSDRCRKRPAYQKLFGSLGA
jgi:hypothetical protein